MDSVGILAACVEEDVDSRRCTQRTILRMLLVCLVVPAAVTLAQEKPAAPAPENPLSTWNKMAYGRVKDILLRSAEKIRRKITL